MQSPIDALLFDLGGVLVDVDWSRAFRAWAEASGVPEAKIAARFKRDASYQAHERGALDDPEFYAWLRRSLGVDLGEEQLLRGWNAILGDPFPGMDALLRLAASRRPVYVFSNTNVPHARHWRHRYAVLLRPVRGVFLSCELGCRKPDRRAFELITAQIATAPNRIAFFDDVEENVDGAISAGLRAFHVRTPAELKATLARLLLIE